MMQQSFSVTQAKDYKKLWLRGSYTHSYLADSDENSYVWRKVYIATAMARHISNFSLNNAQAAKISHLLMMLARGHGNIFNSSDFRNSLDITNQALRKYIEILSGTFMIRILDPWFENIKKRQVKSPKVYIRDSGLLHTLLGIQDDEALILYPRRGASWEGFALEEVINTCHARSEECFFWAIQSGAELDLLIVKNGKRIGFEIKYVDSPKMTKSMVTAMEDLKLDHLYLIHPHRVTYPLAEKMTALSLEDLASIASLFA